MTDLVVAVRLKADGSGLVGQMRLSKESVDELKKATESAGTAAEAMATDLGRAGVAATGAAEASSKAARAILDMAVANARAERATKELKDAQGALASAVEAGGDQQVRAAEAVAAAQQRLVQAQAGVARAQKLSAQAGVEATRSLGQQRSGYQQLGFQIQDITQSIALGANGFTILAQQGGQTASALEQLGLRGVGGRVASFFAGPWGAIFIAAAAALGPMVAQLLSAKSAIEEVTLAGDALGDAQSVLGKAFDLTTGKLKDNTAALLLNARAKEINLRAGALERERNAIGIFSQATEGVTPRKSLLTAAIVAGTGGAAGEVLEGLGLGSNPGVEGLARRAELARRGTRPSATAREREAAYRELDSLLQESDRADFKGAPITKKQFQEALLAIADARSANAVANLINKSLAEGELAPGLRQTSKARQAKPKSDAALEQFGESTGDRLRGITTRYADLPPAVREAQGALQQLDAIAREVQQRKPPNYKELTDQIGAARTAIADGLKGDIDKLGEQFDEAGAAARRTAEATDQINAIITFLNANLEKNPGFGPLIADAEAAKAAIERSVLKPLTDIFDQQRQQLAVGSLILRGRSDEAQALQTVNALQRQGLKLSDDQKNALLAGVQAIAAQGRQIEALQRRQQNLLRLSGDTRAAIVDALSGQSDDLAGTLLSAFRRAFAEQLTEQLYGKLFDDIDATILGQKIDAPAERFETAVNKAVDPLGKLARAADSAASALGSSAGGGVGGAIGGLSGGLGGGAAGGIFGAISALAGASGLSTRAGGTVIDPETADVVVTATRSNKALTSIESLIGGLVRDGFKLLGIDSKAADRLGNVLGAAVKGVGTGLAVSGIAQALGIKLDSTGSAIGGAAGQGLGTLIGGPIGGQIGSLIGSGIGGLLGNLFKPTPKAKGSAITSVDGRIDVTGTDGKAKDAVAQASRAVQDGIQQIADAFGAQIGSFSVSIAKYKDSFRVDPTGSGSDGGKYGDRFVVGIGKFDNNDAAGAIAFAIADAIKDGAIKGISPAVTKALQSSTDINKALREALKVRDIEALIGGPAYAIKRTIDDFDALAAERVTLARKYGLDLLAVERANGEQRAKLLDDTLKSRVGDLKAFLDSVRYGDLFEGSAAERRRQILAEIEQAQRDFDAGVEDAQSRLANLYQQLVTSSRDTFGTSGSEYATDRTTAISGAERNIAAEQARIDAASGALQATTNAMLAGNDLTDETNSLLSVTNARLDTLIAAVNRGGGSAGDISGIYDGWLSRPELNLTIRNFA